MNDLAILFKLRKCGHIYIYIYIYERYTLITFAYLHPQRHILIKRIRSSMTKLLLTIKKKMCMRINRKYKDFANLLSNCR